MPTPQEIRQEQIRREIAKRQKPRGLLEQLPGVGGYIKSAEDALQSVIGRAPNQQELQQGAGDALRIGVDAASLGGADYMAGGNQAELTRQARERMGWAGTAADVTGGALSPIALPKKVMVGGKLAKAGWNAGEAGVQGIIDAYTHNPDASYADLAKAGAVSSGIAGVASRVTEPVASWFYKRKARDAALKALPYKSGDELAAARRAEYDKVKNLGTTYHSTAVADLHQKLDDLKLHPGLDSRALAVIDEYKQRNAGKDLSPEDFDLMRQDIRGTVPVSNPETKYRNKRTIKRVTETMDDFSKRTTPMIRDPATGAYTPAGPETNEALLKARHLATQGKKLDLVNEAKREANRAVARSRGNPFGSSPEQADVAQFSKLSRNIDTGKRSMTPLENSLVKRLEVGTPLRNLGMAAEPWSMGGKFGGWLGIGGMGLHMVPGASIFTGPAALAGVGGSEILSRAGRKTTANQIQDLEAAILDPKGIGTSAAKADPIAVQEARNRLSRLAASGTRTYERGPR